MNMVATRAYNLAASSSKNNFAASSNVFCKQGAPIPPCTLYPPPPPFYPPNFQRQQLLNQVPPPAPHDHTASPLAAASPRVTIHDLKTPPTIPSWRQYDNAAGATSVLPSAGKNAGAYTSRSLTAMSSSNASVVSASPVPSARASAAASGVASAANSGTATPKSSAKVQPNAASCDVFELIRQMEQASLQQRSAMLNAATAAINSADAANAAAAAAAASTTTADSSLLFEPNTLNANFVHSGPAGGLLTPTMFVDNHFQYSTPTTASMYGAGESASAALSQLALPNLGANTPSMAHPQAYSTPPPSASGLDESSPIAAGLKRGMAEMFSVNASKRNPQLNLQAQQLMQQQQQQHNLKHQQQKFQSPKPTVELPEVLASLISKCPPNNFPATLRSSTPSAPNSKPFSFAKTFGQFYPNTTSLGDMPQGCAPGNGGAVVASTDNSIFNSLLALTSNAPPTSGLGFPSNSNNGKAAHQPDAHRF